MIKRIINRIIENYKILQIKRICLLHHMEYHNGTFHFPGGGFCPPHELMKSWDEIEKEWEEKTKDWSEYRKEHGYDEGSYMDIINKKYGGIEDIYIDSCMGYPRVWYDYRNSIFEVS